jgi:surfactin synthase thioesterase subunit
VTITSPEFDLWVRVLRPAPSGAVTLVCLPHAGGSAGSFFPFTELFGSEIEVLAVQYPGRQDRRWEPPARSVEELADCVSTALVNGLGDAPVALFGHSMGAAVAFETARRLEGSPGGAPVALFASGRRAPSRDRPGPWTRPPTDAEVIDELKRLSGTDAAILDDPRLLALFLPVIRADYQAVGGYRGEAGSTISCPITVLVGSDDPETSPDEARAWADHTKGGFGLHTFPGGHFYIEQHRTAVAHLVSDRLAAAAGRARAAADPANA